MPNDEITQQLQDQARIADLMKENARLAGEVGRLRLEVRKYEDRAAMVRDIFAGRLDGTTIANLRQARGLEPL